MPAPVAVTGEAAAFPPGELAEELGIRDVPLPGLRHLLCRREARAAAATGSGAACSVVTIGATATAGRRGERGALDEPGRDSPSGGRSSRPLLAIATLAGKAPAIRPEIGATGVRSPILCCCSMDPFAFWWNGVDWASLNPAGMRHHDHGRSIPCPQEFNLSPPRASG